MANEWLTDAGVFMKPETAKPILDGIAEQLKELWKSHTDTTILSAEQQNEMQSLMSLYVTVCHDFIGRTYFYAPSNFRSKDQKTSQS